MKNKDEKNTVISLNQFCHMDLFCHPLSLKFWTRQDKTLDEDVDSDDEDITDYDELISYLFED